MGGSEPQSCGDAPAGENGILLLCWNVAGWTSTHHLVRSHYGAINEYLTRLGRPAVLCVQETKVKEKNLKNVQEARQLGAVLDGYRSYWAFNQHKDPMKSYLQGVATWVREDVPVVGATQQVTGVPELDQQGRALLTDHGSFAVLNTYAHHVSDKEDAQGAQQEKLRFLAGLQKRMLELRAQGRRVIVCGDLNLTYRPLDQRAERRLLRADHEGYFPPLRGSEQRLGPVPEWADQWVPVRDASGRLNLEMEALAAAGECLHIREGECVQWLRRLVGADGAADPAAAAGEAAPWADVFAEVHPKAEDRFTCWNQMANTRYINYGTRIDYVLVDRGTLQDCVVRSPPQELLGGVADDGADALSAKAALNAATLFGKWLPAAGDGLSLQTDNMSLNNQQFPRRPCTGIVYTPPSYSDHAMLSALFRSSLLAAAGSAGPTRLTAQETRQCQPWHSQPSIGAFFGGKPRQAQPTPPAPAPARATPRREAVPEGPPPTGVQANGRPSKPEEANPVVPALQDPVAAPGPNAQEAAVAAEAPAQERIPEQRPEAELPADRPQIHASPPPAEVPAGPAPEQPPAAQEGGRTAGEDAPAPGSQSPEPTSGSKLTTITPAREVEMAQKREAEAEPTPEKSLPAAGFDSFVSQFAFNDGSEPSGAPPATGGGAGKAPPKKRKRADSKANANSAKATTDPALQEAEALGLGTALRNLASREAIRQKGIPMAELLAALRAADGLVNKAKAALLGA